VEKLPRSTAGPAADFDAGSRALVVSLHDVSPLTHRASDAILGELAEIGIDRASLLVIPDHHRRAHFLKDVGFCRWLADKAVEGHEIVTHGYHHRRTRRAHETVFQRLTTRIYTADEGEFYDLDRESARTLVTRGNEELRSVGFDPRGFIAPAWLLGPEAKLALCDLDVEYTTTLGGLEDLDTGRAWKSQSLVWSVRSAWRRAASLAWNATLFQRLRENPLLRISIHPVDLQHVAIWKQIRTLVARALADREALTYHAWITRQRTSPPATFNSQRS
jgi:predicted deacetylase